MPAPPLKDELSFSPNPKMVGERNPDSVLFKINDLSGEDEKPPARGKNEILDDADVTEKAPRPAIREITTPEQEEAASSGLIKVQDLLDREAEAANAIPSAPINPGLIPEPTVPPEPVVAEPVQDVAPPSKMPMMMMVAGGLVVLLAAAAVAMS